jgi:hypothetical protein
LVKLLHERSECKKLTGGLGGGCNADSKHENATDDVIVVVVVVYEYWKKAPANEVIQVDADADAVANAIWLLGVQVATDPAESTNAPRAALYDTMNESPLSDSTGTPEHVVASTE